MCWFCKNFPFFFVGDRIFLIRYANLEKKFSCSRNCFLVTETFSSQAFLSSQFLLRTLILWIKFFTNFITEQPCLILLSASLRSRLQPLRFIPHNTENVFYDQKHTDIAPQIALQCSSLCLMTTIHLSYSDIKITCYFYYKNCTHCNSLLPKGKNMTKISHTKNSYTKNRQTTK